MKKLLIITAILITGFFASAKSETKIINHSGFEFGFFYSNLAPYGSWIEIDAGLVVWRPTIIRKGWSPYRHGRWIWTVDGWYWDSYEPFGYIVFHYGRWYYDDYYGWIWIPDYDWAPAWVEWRYDDDYIGWAPLPPYAVFSIHIGIHYTHNYYVPYHHWYYVRYNRFCDPYVYNYYVAPKYKYRIHNRTKVRHNYGYRNGHIVNRGVDIDHIRKRSGQDIRQRDIVRVNDYKEFEKYRNKNDNVVRTFVASRDELKKSRSNDIKIEKKERRSTLDVSKVRLGREDMKERNLEQINKKERSAGRDKDKRNDVIKKDRNNNSDVKRNNDVEIKRNETIKTERKKNSDFDREKKAERKDVQKKEVNIQRNSNENRKSEVRKENMNSNRNNFEQQKKDVQRREVNIQRNNDVNRKIEVKKENTNNNRSNFEQQKKEIKNQVRTGKKSDDDSNRNNNQVERKNNSNNNKNKRSR